MPLYITLTSYEYETGICSRDEGEPIPQDEFRFDAESWYMSATAADIKCILSNGDTSPLHSAIKDLPWVKHQLEKGYAVYLSAFQPIDALLMQTFNSNYFEWWGTNDEFSLTEEDIAKTKFYLLSNPNWSTEP